MGLSSILFRKINIPEAELEYRIAYFRSRAKKKLPLFDGLFENRQICKTGVDLPEFVADFLSKEYKKWVKNYLIYCNSCKEEGTVLERNGAFKCEKCKRRWS